MKRQGALPACFSCAAMMICLTPGVLAANSATLPSKRGKEGRSAASEVRIGWKDVLRLVEKHPELAAARHEVAASRSGVGAAGAVPNPVVDATTAYARANDGSASAVEWGLGVSLPLGWLSRRGPEVEKARAGARIAKAEAELSHRELLLVLGGLFWRLVYAQERVAALEELSAETADLADTVKERVAGGETRPIEAVRVEVEAESVAGELDAAKAQLTAYRSQLNRALGLAPQQLIIAEAELEMLPEPISAEGAQAKARASHPQNAAAAAHVQALEAEARAERRARIPSMEITGFADQELDRRAFGVGLGVELPVFNWNTDRIRQVESQLAAARERREAVQRSIEGAAIEAQAACRAGERRAHRYQGQILPRAASVAKTIERTYALGEAGLLEVIDARRTLLDTRRRYLDILVQAHLDCNRLLALTAEKPR